MKQRTKRRKLELAKALLRREEGLSLNLNQRNRKLRIRMFQKLKVLQRLNYQDQTSKSPRVLVVKGVLYQVQRRFNQSRSSKITRKGS